MTVDRRQRYDDPDEFFRWNGSVWMFLTREAAVEVCRRAFAKGLAVACIEGGIWHNPKFEPRGNCIWDGLHRPMDSARAEGNNAEAASFIERAAPVHDTFLITTWAYAAS